MTDRHTNLCPCDWKEKIMEMWRRLQETIKGVKVNGERIWPDGDGIVNISVPGSDLEERVEDLEDAVEQIEPELAHHDEEIDDLITQVTGIQGTVNLHSEELQHHSDDILDLETNKQGKLTAGANITITPDNVISASGTIGTTWGLIGGDINAQLDLKNALDAKMDSAKLTHETWTFTLDDDTTVTKEVVLYVS